MEYILPALIMALLLYALIKGVDLYAAFVEGAAEALPLLLQVLPYVAAMLMAMSLLRGSGALDLLLRLLSPLLRFFGLPPELAPLFLLRPFSGSASLALLQDVYDTCGVDSRMGFAASVMLGSTETIFYTVALYFGSVKVTKTRYTIPVALLAGVAGAAASLLLTALWWRQS